jgi:hypothetical protein
VCAQCPIGQAIDKMTANNIAIRINFCSSLEVVEQFTLKLSAQLG